MFDNPFIHCPSEVSEEEFMEFTDIQRNDLHYITTNYFKLKVKKLNEDAVIPEWRGFENGGLDISSCENKRIEAGKIERIRTGISTEFNSDLVCLLRDRSGLGAKGLHVLAGVIDSGYRGEWTIIIVNLSNADYHVVKGERVAQGIFVCRIQPAISEILELSESERGVAGFGSSGRL